MITLYGIKTCDSVKKALKFFKEASIEVEFVDFKKTAPSVAQVTQWAQESELKKLFNNRSRTYKELGLSTQTLSDDDKINWMHKSPLLIKRPVIESKHALIVGFNQTQYKGIFQS